VRTNADTPEDSARAREFGAQGIGLCRTEHMFFDPERILAMREMILAEDVDAPRAGAQRSCCPTSGTTSSGIFDRDEGPARDDPSARSAPARVPAQRCQ
jgi:pyruvate,orthophosphate dikinase